MCRMQVSFGGLADPFILKFLLQAYLARGPPLLHVKRSYTSIVIPFVGLI